MVRELKFAKDFLFKNKLDLIQGYPQITALCRICLLLCIVERERTPCESTGNQSTTLAMPKESANEVDSVMCVLAEKWLRAIAEVMSNNRECAVGSDDSLYPESALYCSMALFNPCVLVGLHIGKIELLKKKISWYMLDGNCAW